MKKHFFLIIFFFISFSLEEKILTDELIKKLLKNYAKIDPPSLPKTTFVKLGIRINSFYSINEATMDYMLSFYLEQSWLDLRLKFNKSDLGGRGFMNLGVGVWSKFWLPDTFFRNEKKANLHDVTVANRMLLLQNNGLMFYNLKISATFSCQMQLQRYPLDTQICPITIESFGYTTAQMNYTWSLGEGGTPEISLGDIRQLPQFTLEKFTTHTCIQNYTAGEYPCLEVRFVLRRDIGYFLIQVYVPSILIVILSWISFWINIESSPARVSIGLLTVLTTTTMSAGARSSLPKVSYIKAIDVWMIICLIFVFASLIEYAIVNVISRKFNQRTPFPQSKKCLECVRMNSKPEVCNCLKCKSYKSKPEIDGKRKARNMDKLARQGFPISFILFNFVYWTAYTFPSTTDTS